MADNDQNTVILEESDAANGIEAADAPPIEEFREVGEENPQNEGETQISEGEPSEPAKKPKIDPQKLGLIIFLAASALAYVGAQLVALMFFVPRETPQADTAPMPDTTQMIAKAPPAMVFAPSRVDDMLAKADSLYQSGDKFEALKIYESIALYNESLSNYNLGVSQMNQNRCDEAIRSFDKAISDSDNITVSSINAAVCSLEMGDRARFEYYIDLAGSFVSRDATHPELYTYYEALVDYYKGDYVEALQILESHPGGYYADPKRYLKSKILAFMGDDRQAIEKLNALNGYDVSWPLGLLYARQGDYESARRFLNRALADEKNEPKVELALELIDLKTGQYASAANRLRYAYNADKTLITGSYPIKVELSPRLFDLPTVQANFDIDSFYSRANIYQILFYYTPFKVFDAKQTMTYIRKGGLSEFIAQHEQADSYLSASSAISRANLELSRSVALALNHKLRAANAAFNDIVKIYSGHSLLHYNLALTYAQLGQFADAYKHFVTSYHLDLSNHISGVYAILCGQLIGRDIRKLTAEVRDNIASDKNIKDADFYDTLIQFANGNTNILQRWLDSEHPRTALNVAFDAIAAHLTGQPDIIATRTQVLKELLPDDIVAKMLHSTARFTGSSAQDYALDIINRFLNNPIDRRALYGSATIIKVQFVHLLQLAGLLEIERANIKEDLKKATDNAADIMRTLAYIDLFTGHYEEAFVTYNELINTHKMQDNRTLFYAAVAGVGAGHNESAIGYLELARLNDPTSVEERLALGLLYQAAGNVDAAANQFANLGDSGFLSEFFTFSIDR